MDILLKTSLDEVIFSGWLYESMNELIKQRYITREYREEVVYICKRLQIYVQIFCST